MKVYLLIIKMKDFEEQFIMMEVIMKDNINKILEKDLGNMFGLKATSILVNVKKIKGMDSENIFSEMDIMKENINKVIEKVMGHTFIMMGKY